MMDNGAFTAYTQGKSLDYDGFVEWCNEFLQPPHWAVIPDVIDGSVEQQREYLKRWPFPKELSAPVFHLGLDLDWMLELADNYPRFCLGSSGEFWQIGTRKWHQRMDQVFELLAKKRFMPWVHGMRMLGQSDGKYPLASADSSNIARHHAELRISPEVMAQRIDSLQPAKKWKPSPQLSLIGED
jgi:hypothetical protein